MKLTLLIVIALCSHSIYCLAQDSTYNFEEKAVTLKEVVVRSHLNIPAFIQRVKDDTTFHKAFLNLKVLGYTSINDIRMLNKKGATLATLNGRTKQFVHNHCRWTKAEEQKTTGDMLDKNNNFNYYTAQMYSSIFFAPDTVCGETNVVAGTTFSTEGKTGISRHKEQLKMLFFNPGKRIPGLPLIGNKVALFDKNVMDNYDFIIDMAEYNNELCYVFKMIPLPDKKNSIVINEMTTWFSQKSWEILGRNYDLSYKAGVYDFDVHIEVEMTKFRELIVPRVLRYNGNWNVMFKKREIGIFTATLFDFHQ